MTVKRGIGQGFGFGIGCLLLVVAIGVTLVMMGSAAQNNAQIGQGLIPTRAPVAAPPSRVLLTLADRGIQRTERFTTTGDWQIDYASDCTSFGFDGNFIVTVYSGDGSIVDLAANELGKSGMGTQPEYRAGTFYLDVNTPCAWNIGVKG